MVDQSEHAADLSAQRTIDAIRRRGWASGRGVRIGLKWLLRWWKIVSPFGYILSALGWLADLGTKGYDADTRRRLKILNLIAYLIAATTLIYAVQHSLMDYSRFALLIWVNAALVPIAILVPFSHRFSPIAGGLIIVIAEWIGLTLITSLLGTDSGVHMQFFIAAAAAFVVFGLERIRLVLATVISALALHLYCAFALPPDSAFIAEAPQVVDGIYIQAVVTTTGLIGASVWYAFQLVETAKAETDMLLRNILPDDIVERLKTRPGEVVADSHDSTAVLFADVVGFVALAKSLGPEKVVRLLNELVRAFDSLAEQHGVEKIKTMGDGYMAVAGVPTPIERPTVRLAAFALDMLAEVERVREQHGLELQLRLGMASGPLMAGVIGTRKFTYDVWGDTVNLAARLENRSAPGRLLVCPASHAKLEAEFELESHGEVDIKGVGKRPVWFVVKSKTGDHGVFRHEFAGEDAAIPSARLESRTAS